MGVKATFLSSPAARIVDKFHCFFNESIDFEVPMISDRDTMALV